MARSRLREVVVEVFTDTQRITGRLSTNEGRLSDTLNYELPHVIVLSEASTTPLDQPEKPTVVEGAVHIDTEAIALAVPRSAEPDLEERLQTRMFDHLEKERHKAVVNVSPFQLEGELHLPKGNDVQRSLWNLTPGFIPVSDATVTFGDRPGTTWDSEIVIVNRRRARITLPQDEHD